MKIFILTVVGLQTEYVKIFDEKELAINAVLKDVEDSSKDLGHELFFSERQSIIDALNTKGVWKNQIKGLLTKIQRAYISECEIENLESPV